MTDFRRPDLDLWEEEDAEDARPTIVSERPTSAVSASSPVRKATKASDKTIPFGTVPGDRKTPEVQRSSLVQRLIEQGALEEDGAARNSSEVLRDSEIDLLKLPDEPAEPTLVEPTLELVTAASPKGIRSPQLGEVPRAADAAKQRGRVIEGIESEPASDDQVPTVSVKRPLPPVSVELKSTMAVLPVAEPRPTPESRSAVQERPSSERDITERISIPSGMVGSIAPASRTFRPPARERKGMPFWQTALAALVLLGGGISIAKFQAEQRNQTATLSSQPTQTADEESTLPTPPADTIADPAAAAPVPEPPVASAANSDGRQLGPQPAAPTPPAEQPLTPSAPAALPTPANIGPLLPKRDENVVPVSRTRRVREQRAVASAEPEATAEEVPAPPPIAVAAPKPAGKSGEPLPAHPSREQVVSSLNSVTPELQRCVGDRHGVAEVTVTVRPAGFVSYAVVSGGYAGTVEGSCIARAVRAAKFPAFNEPMLRVTYPFQL